MTTPRKRQVSAPTAISTPSSKRQRTVLTLEKRIELINASEENPLYTHKELSEKFGVGRSSVSEILTRKEFFRDKFTKNSGLHVQRFKHGKREDINAAVYKWFCQARSKNISLTGAIIQDFALDLAKEVGDLDFKASNGWLDNWKRKYEIKFYKVSGESNAVSKFGFEKLKSKSPELLSSIAQSDIFNCDETGLYFRALPDRSRSESTKCKRSVCEEQDSEKEQDQAIADQRAVEGNTEPRGSGDHISPDAEDVKHVEGVPETTALATDAARQVESSNSGDCGEPMDLSILRGSESDIQAVETAPEKGQSPAKSHCSSSTSSSSSSASSSHSEFQTAAKNLAEALQSATASLSHQTAKNGAEIGALTREVKGLRRDLRDFMDWVRRQEGQSQRTEDGMANGRPVKSEPGPLFYH